MHADLDSQKKPLVARLCTELDSGLAVRIAQEVSLHLSEPPLPVQPFEREIRRRLWHGSGFLDVETAMEGASEPHASKLV